VTRRWFGRRGGSFDLLFNRIVSFALPFLFPRPQQRLSGLILASSIINVIPSTMRSCVVTVGVVARCHGVLGCFPSTKLRQQDCCTRSRATPNLGGTRRLSLGVRPRVCQRPGACLPMISMTRPETLFTFSLVVTWDVLDAQTSSHTPGKASKMGARSHKAR
jgi:hypothetical protein